MGIVKRLTLFVRRGTPRGPRPLSVRTIVVCGAIVVLCTMLAVALLLWPTPMINLSTPNDQFDAVRLVLVIGGAAAGAMTLLLAARRQVHSEHVAQDAVLDAAERRITELYVKAVEQLGSEKAPVRLGGMYALERLANRNPDHRQTVVNVICSYLRMPFNAEVESEFSLPEAIGIPEWRDSRANLTSASREEREVRVAAQEILCRHLQGASPLPSYSGSENWGLLTLNLKGATLADFNAQCMVVGEVAFDYARFQGLTMFNESSFQAYASFTGCTFEADLLCESVEFSCGTSFMGATFGDLAYFRGVKFDGSHSSVFRGATFSGAAYFHQSTFSSLADFHGADFRTAATFAAAKLMGSGKFQSFRLAEDPYESGTGSGSAEFVNAQFRGGISFEGVSLVGQAGFSGAQFHSELTFKGINNESLVLLEGAYARLDVADQAKSGRYWPCGWGQSSQVTRADGVPERGDWGQLMNLDSVDDEE